MSKLKLTRSKLEEDRSGKRDGVKYWVNGEDGLIASLVYHPYNIPTEMAIRIGLPKSLGYESTEVRGSESIMDKMTFPEFEAKVRQYVERYKLFHPEKVKKKTVSV